ILLAGRPADVFHYPLGGQFLGLGFLSHLHSLMVTMSQKSSVPQLAISLSQALMSDTVLPRTSGFDVERLGAKFCEPAAHDLCSHLRTVVRADVVRHAPFEHHIGHCLDDPKAVDATATLIARHSRVNSSIKVMSRS